MTRIKSTEFLNRHQFQAVDKTSLTAAADPQLKALGNAPIDDNGDGVIDGAGELGKLYTQLLALDPQGTPQTGFDDAGPAGRVYGALATLLRQRTGQDAPLGNQTLAQIPALAAVIAGGPGVVLHRVDGKTTVGTGSLQDALKVVAAADEAKNGGASTFRVNLGAAQKNRGLFGPGTESAVKAFQTAHGLPSTGVADSNTLKALDTALAQARAPVTTTTTTTSSSGAGHPRFAGNAVLDDVRAGRTTLGAGAHGPAVVAVQQALLDMGFSMRAYVYGTASGRPVGGVDGAFGNQSTTCVTNFQQHAKAFFPGVRVTGVVDAATFAALEALAPAVGATSDQPGQPQQAPAPFWNGDAHKRLKVVVVKDQHRTFLFDAQGKIAHIFSNSVGRMGAATHTGLKKVTAFLDAAACAALSQRLWQNNNSFGDRLVDLSWADRTPTATGEELHGTGNDRDLGMDVSHGCMRHYNADILVMYSALHMNDLVAVVDSINDPRLKAPAGSTPNV
jgi:peptidoglycan hydrolase-like protein with peptidoglycan-binding domain